MSSVNCYAGAPKTSKGMGGCVPTKVASDEIKAERFARKAERFWRELGLEVMSVEQQVECLAAALAWEDGAMRRARMELEEHLVGLEKGGLCYSAE